MALTKTTTKFACPLCCSTYSFKSGLSRHMKDKHHGCMEEDDPDLNCQYCGKRFKTIKSRTAHLGTSHKENICIVKYVSFDNTESFLQWKNSEERKTQTSYVQQCGTKRKNDEERTYYYCNRHGNYKPKGNDQRAIKSQGTSKIGDKCTAFMKVTKCMTNGSISVEYCVNHSHEIAIAHLRIPNDSRASVAEKLINGVQVDKVLDQVRNAVPDTLGREHLINKQDIHNIGRQFNVDGVQKHTSDSESIHAWVSELQCGDYDPVLLYKAQGLDDISVGKSSEAFQKDDFALCIQTRFQCDMLKQFGSNCVCLDSTHSTNQYDFPLTTLMVIDEFGEGIPVAYMVSNHETGKVIEALYESIKVRVGVIEPEVIMTDDAPQYFSAWQKVFGQNSRTKKLLCRWHLDRTWRRAIKEKVDNSELQPEIYRHLIVLLQENTHVEFTKKLQQFLSYLTEKGAVDFLHYFQQNYCSRINEWATHARCYTIVNTNMHIESFHRLNCESSLLSTETKQKGRRSLGRFVEII